MKPKYRFNQHRVSLATGPAGVLIAVNPSYQKLERDYLSWFDPEHQRRFDIKKITENKTGLLAWVDKRGRKFTLSPMTLEAYTETVAPEIPGAREFTTHEDLVHWFTKGIWEETYGV